MFEVAAFLFGLWLLWTAPLLAAAGLIALAILVPLVKRAGNASFERRLERKRAEFEARRQQRARLA